MNESNNTNKTENTGMTPKRRNIAIAIGVIIVILAIFKAPSFIGETKELLQIFPAIPGVIGSIGKEAVAEKADLKPVEEAVGNSTPRVTSAEVKKTLNGFSVEVDVYLTVNDATPITQEELLAVLKALWQTAPFEPDAVTIRADTADAVVDVKSAANMLSGVRVLDYNKNSTTIQQLDGLLGPWKKPN